MFVYIDLVRQQNGDWHYFNDSQLPCVVLLGQLSVTEAATLFEPKTLAHLKHEYGGLKTLLRNYPQVFQG